MGAMAAVSSVFLLISLVAGVVVVMASVVTVQQGNVAVLTMFGKYSRILRPGLGFKIPFVETVAQRISIQNRSADLSFQAITADQANVGFQAMLLYAVVDQEENTIKNVAFKFIDYQSFMQALVRTVEGSVRSFVAKKRQAEILSLRREIIEEVKSQLDASLEAWGYHLIDLQMNDIRFDEVVMRSMAEVVASTNLRAAAENQGQALFITKTKQAEADAAAIRIAAEAERSASQLRGQGIALLREEVARGLSQAAKEIQVANLDASFLLFTMWTEAVKHFGETGRGNVIFLDGSTEAMGRSMKDMMAMTRVHEINRP